LRFLLVDRILELETGKRAVAIKNVTLSEDFFAHHFPEDPIMPGMLITESLVQLADWVIRECSEFREMGLASSFERLQFRRFVRPGDQLHLEVEIVNRTAGRAAIKGKASCDGSVVAVGDFNLAVHPIEAWLSADDARRLYRLICPYAKEERQ